MSSVYFFLFPWAFLKQIMKLVSDFTVENGASIAPGTNTFQHSASHQSASTWDVSHKPYIVKRLQGRWINTQGWGDNRDGINLLGCSPLPHEHPPLLQPLTRSLLRLPSPPPWKPATITFVENKDVNSWIKFRLLYDNSFVPALGAACAMRTNNKALIQTCQIQAIMTVPESCLSLHSCQTAMLAHVGTEWHILAHVGFQLSPPFIHYNSFSGSFKFFHFKKTLGLALGESWCATTEKH